MSGAGRGHGADHLELLSLYALGALPAGESAGAEERLAECAECRTELAALRPVVAALASWPPDVLHPSASVWERLSRRLADETGQPPLEAPRPAAQPDWEDAAPGIQCRILATDEQTGRVSMLVRLAPGTEYPPHTHAGVEELHMLEGELMVGEKKLQAGDYLRSEPGTSDHHVWSETGCLGVLITSAHDRLL